MTPIYTTILLEDVFNDGIDRNLDSIEINRTGKDTFTVYLCQDGKRYFELPSPIVMTIGNSVIIGGVEIPIEISNA